MQNRYKIIIAYDGTNYHGWQRQPGKKTIQSLIEKALCSIAKKKTSIMGSGRTDAGVHALGQCAHFNFSFPIADNDLFRALNSLLPSDIKITSLIKTNKDFHAIRSSISKIYQYRILNSRDISPFDMRFVYQWYGPLDIEAMKSAAQLFKREANFNPFSSNKTLYPVRRVIDSRIEKKGDEILFTIEANGFLRYMVRAIVGTILEIGKGRLAPPDVEDIFASGKRTRKAPTAPAKGLCLIKVFYDSPSLSKTD